MEGRLKEKEFVEEAERLFSDDINPQKDENARKIAELFSRPSTIGIVADPDEGKSNLIYYILETLKREGSFNLYTYALRVYVDGAQEINSLREMESIRNSIIILDEMKGLLDLDNRKKRDEVESSLRLIFHNNNVIVMCGTGDNFKKFISGKLGAVFFKKTTIDTLINNSAVKNLVMSYKGYERGTTLLDMPQDEALLWDGKHFTRMQVPYLEEYDTKKANKEIIRREKR